MFDLNTILGNSNTLPRPNRFCDPTLYAAAALSLLVPIGLCGCAQQLTQPSPPASPPFSAQQTEMGASRFGSFNLHKRHGLGGWQGNSQANQHQWLQKELQQVQKADDAANPALSQPASSRLK